MPRPIAGAKSSRLQRRRLLQRAWQQYLEGTEPRGVRQEILSSWRRSRECYHIDPRLRRPGVSIPPEGLEERHGRDEALRLAVPILDDFTGRMKLRDHVLAYFDAEACMLTLEGDRSIAEAVAEIGYCPGVSWAEESAGTNATGTALAIKEPIEVFAAEHYVEAWQRWSSAAVPIRALGPAPVGVVAMTGPWEVRRRQAGTFVLALARAIEERLRAAAGVRDEVVRYAFRSAGKTGDALVAVDPHGRIIARNEAAARSILLEDGALVPAALDAVVKALCAPDAPFDDEVRLEPEGASAIVSRVRYEGLRIGAILRVSPPSLARSRPGTLDRSAARHDFRCVLGSCPRLRHAVELATVAARNDLPVVLTGEPGTGKELLAQTIHAASCRRDRRFVAVGCGAIPAELLEAELFGCAPGAAPGALRDGKLGCFEEADGGTVFLDEVTDLAPAAQAALLRLLKEEEVAPIGGGAPRRVDVRVLAATNRPLEEEMRAGRFRADLYYRLNVLWIAVPPLRERAEDVSLLARAFLEEADVERLGLTLSPDALEALRTYHWPGNVRELKGVILRAAAAASRPEITAHELVFAPAGTPSADPDDGAAERSPELERAELMTALDACAWNFRRTAHQLGISRMTLYRWLRKYGISRASPPAP